MSRPRSPDTRPRAVDLQAGEEVWWCSCGGSKSQPFCDGSHKGTGFQPVAFRAERADRYYFCQCKLTGNKPLCDGSHKQLAPAD